MPPLHDDIPDTARVGVVGVLRRLVREKYVEDWRLLAEEALHVARTYPREFLHEVREKTEREPDTEEICTTVIIGFEWNQFYTFCERVYKLLQAQGEWEDEWVETVPLSEVQEWYTDEINELLSEENLAYEFGDGVFQRRGRPQTQKVLQQVATVLADPRHSKVKKLFNKAVDSFQQRPEPDVENCIKDAVCALESCLEVLFGSKASKDFDKVLSKRSGSSEGQIPPPLAKGIKLLRAFRGDATGVAHAAPDGAKVSVVEAELTLSLVGSYITYLNDKFPPEEEEVPF